MKISVNWMLDHIETPISKLDVGLIAAKFNVHTAEIESYEKFDLNIDNLFIVRVQSIDQNGLFVRCDELNQSFQLPFRNDLNLGSFALIRRSQDLLSWEKLQQYSASKEGLFPAVECHQDLIAGGWKKDCEDKDYILDVDNKSINHRPDLWGHRGIAREVAAFMGWTIKPLDRMLAKIDQIDYAQKSAQSVDSSMTLVIENESICQRLAALYCHDITHKPSQIWMAMRLARVDSKPINTIIDTTNYVMFDISQPMHVFDAANFPERQLTVRTAQPTESLELLDGHMTTLTHQDVVITDGTDPVALAGVMGGKKASFSSNARAIIIESGSFNATMIRNSATRVKITTEASTRFSKQLDPMQNTIALQRFIFIAQGLGVITSLTEKIVSVGHIINPSRITVSHDFIQDRLGISLDSNIILSLLKKLDFGVDVEHQGSNIMYTVIVPTVRMTKDITIPEDIVEEVARLYGFENITYKRPVRAMQSFDMSHVLTLRKMKEHCAFAMNMHEVRDYLFYDESFLKRLGWYPANAVAVKNPVSENWKVLVTSLVPHLIKNIELNSVHHDQINFFEHNTIWAEISKEEALEKKSLAGIFFGQKNMNFYDYKAQLQGLFASIGLHVSWVRPTTSLEPWFDQLQTVDIILDGAVVGRAGMLDATFVRGVIKGQGFVFELQADLIVQYKKAEKLFTPWSKYQAVFVDISVLIDACVTSATLERIIAQTDSKIDRVSLLDFFEKDSWAGKRSLTFRYRICDFEQNLTKETIDGITYNVIQAMVDQGAQIR